MKDETNIYSTNYNPKTIKKERNYFSDEDIKYLHPKLQMLAKSLLEEANKQLNSLGYSVKIAETIRSYNDQLEIYKKGREFKSGEWIVVDKRKVVSNAKPGRSVHNWGCAFDVRIIKDSKYIPNDENKVYTKTGAIGRNLGLTWGGDFKSIVDMPHFQYTGKHNNSTFLNLANEGIPIDKILSSVLI